MTELTHTPNRLRNTNSLVRLIYTKVIALNGRQPSVSELYGLSKLAWITKGKSTDTYITGAKIPGLENCLALQEGGYNSARGIDELDKFVSNHFSHFSTTEKEVILNPSGFVNTRGPYRNSPKKWIEQNTEKVRNLFKVAYELDRDDKKRLEIYSDIAKLPRVPTGGKSNGSLNPAYLVTPVIFCLDPYLRSPVINGSKINQAHLKSIGADSSNLIDCASRMISEIDQNDDFLDAADLDFYLQSGKLDLLGHKTEGRNLPTKDDEDIKVIKKGGEVKASQFHNTLTNELENYLATISLIEGDRPDCRYDALITKDQIGRNKHLLIEVKSSNETANIRLAIGQLLHYKYNMSAQYSDPDLAILVPEKPKKRIINFLNELDIYTIWGRETDWNITGRDIDDHKLKEFLNGSY